MPKRPESELGPDLEAPNPEDIYSITDIQIVPIKPKDGLVGFASVIFNNLFYFGSLAIMTKLGGGYRVVYPKRKIGTKYLNVFHPVNKAVGRAIEAAIAAKFESLTQPNDEWLYDNYDASSPE